MRIIVFFTSVFFLALQSNLGQTDTKTSNSSIYVEAHQFTSKVFDNTRTLRVLLPLDYHKNTNQKKDYPILYLNDGITVFRRYNLEETVHRLIKTKAIPPLIIVGIDNGTSTDKPKKTGDDRANEFLPYPDVGFAPDRLYEPNPPDPIGKMFPKFIEEVMKFIEQKYRIKKGAKNTGIGGSSYGAVAALYTTISSPNLFGKLLLESTPLWIGRDKQLLKDIQLTRKWSSLIYVGSGTNESPDEIITNEGRTLQEELIKSIKRNSPKTIIKSVLEEGAKHEASAWARRFPTALQFLFSEKGMPNNFNKQAM